MNRMLMALLAAALAAGPLRAQDPAPRPLAERTLTVSAVGTATREPDRARVHLTVETLGTTAAQATQSNNARMTELTARLRGLGLTGDQVRTVGFELHPEYARERPLDQQEPRIVGYRARNTVQVTVDDIPALGTILDAAIAAGADRVSGLWFELRDPSVARADALRNAVGLARAEAAAIAAALGEPLGPVLDVSTTGATPIRPPMPPMRAEMSMAMDVPIEPGTLEIAAFVTVVYRLGSP